ncbi:pepsinogen a [Stylonychia lemnae]|uniref:Pepsinogen a n=1 Tax=Stylonychia lemnae TaxID=5949 RepID=A0A078ADW7_STYLE|nr:pepsinogen a [Stylonychia lemnae]|eukprot:CDW80046.1 pepsinogen a [Stylonychia lemnae]
MMKQAMLKFSHLSNLKIFLLLLGLTPLTQQAILDLELNKIDNSLAHQLQTKGEEGLDEWMSNNQHKNIDKSGLYRAIEGVVSDQLLQKKQNTYSQKFLDTAAGSLILQQYDDQQEQIFEKELRNYLDIQYFGTLYLGSQQEDMTFIFDTGSSWLWAPTKDCKICHKSEKYDPKVSEFFEQISDEPTVVTYGTGQVRGYLSQDQVCLQKNLSSCLQEFQFLSVFETYELGGLKSDGVIGLAPSSYRSGPNLFIDELYQNGLIENRVFSFYMANDGFPQPQKEFKSRLTFGGYNASIAGKKFEDYGSPTWNELINSNYWSVQLVGARLGDKQLQMSTNIAIVDTGTSYLLMPNPDFDQLVTYFQNYLICGQDQQKNLFKCLCTEQIYQNFPNIKIQIGNNVYSFPKEKYVLPFNGTCYFMIMNMTFREGTGLWILGDNFLQSYLTIFDYDNLRVGFIGESKYEEIPKTMIEYLTYFVLGLLLVVIIFVIFQLCFNHKPKEDNDGGYKRTRSNDRPIKRETTSDASPFGQPLLTVGGTQTDRQQKLLD